MGTAAAEPGQRRRRQGGAGVTAALERQQRLRRKCGGEAGIGVSNGGGECIILGAAEAAQGKWQRQKVDLPLSPSIIKSNEL